MTLFLWLREYVKKLSNINKVEIKKAVVYFFYTDLEGKQRKKHLPYRANRTQLLSVLATIKKEIKYEERKSRPDPIKLAGFVYSRIPIKVNDNGSGN
jgi:hypothetical protein